MKYIRDILLLLIAGLLLALLIKGCEKKFPPQQDKTQIIIDSLQMALKNQPKDKLNDTIKLINTFYRDRFNTVERWIFDTTWNNFSRFLDSIGIHAPDQKELQRLVGYGLVRGQRDSALVVIYRAQRSRDSTAKVILTTLDSLKSERITNLIQQNNKMQHKADKRAKWAKVAHWIALAGGVAILILK